MIDNSGCTVDEFTVVDQLSGHTSVNFRVIGWVREIVDAVLFQDEIIIIQRLDNSDFDTFASESLVVRFNSLFMGSSRSGSR